MFLVVYGESETGLVSLKAIMHVHEVASDEEHTLKGQVKDLGGACPGNSWRCIKRA